MMYVYSDHTIRLYIGNNILKKIPWHFQYNVRLKCIYVEEKKNKA